MDEKTARKYRQLEQLPSQCAAARWWRTRPDPFVAVWPQRKNMTTAAAIDRLLHHRVIWELNVTSYRLENAQKSRRTASSTQPKEAYLQHAHGNSNCR